MKNKMNDLESIRKIREALPHLDYSSYSGRGACGDVWPAFNTDNPLDFFADVLEEDALTTDEIVSLMRRMTQDSPMIYWRIRLEDPQDIENDYDEDEDEDEDE